MSSYYDNRTDLDDTDDTDEYPDIYGSGGYGSGYGTAGSGMGDMGAGPYSNRGASGDWGSRDWGEIVRENRMPLALIAAGLGWVLLTEARHTGTYRQTRNWAGRRMGSMTGGTGAGQQGGMTGRLRERADRAMHSLREGAEHLRERAGETYEDMRGRMPGSRHEGTASGPTTGEYFDRIADYDSRRDTAMYGESSRSGGMKGASTGGMARQIGRRADEIGRSLWDMVDEYPLAAGLMGLALGAAIGASLPATRTEDDWLGEYRDRFWDQARGYGGEAVERAGRVARDGLHAGAQAMSESLEEEADTMSDTAQGAGGSDTPQREAKAGTTR